MGPRSILRPPGRTGEEATPTATADRNRIKVIARAAAVLRALAGNPKGMTLSELSEQVELPRSTTHRIVAALAAEDLVFGSRPGRLRLGPGLIRLAAAERLDVRAEVRPYLEELSARLNETVDLAVLDGASVLFLDQVSAPRALRAVSAVGSVFPAYCTANGKALLAELAPEELAELVPAELPRFTPDTLGTRAELEAQLEEVRRRGYAVDNEEHTVGISAVGASVRDSLDTEMAVTVPLPTQRFEGRETEIAEALIATCAKIEEALGASE